MLNLVSIADDIWIAFQPQKFFGLEVGTRMTIIRLSSGELILISPIQMEEGDRKQLEQLVNEILDLQKLSAGQLQLQTQSTELQYFFELNLNQFESLAASKGIAYTYQIEIPKDYFQSLCIFDHRTDRKRILSYIHHDLPFVVRGDPQVLEGKRNFITSRSIVSRA